MRENKICGIYCIENKINNKKYIGQSVDVSHRWYCHRRELRNNIHDNDCLQKSWLKYGERNFDFYILEYCSIDELDKREALYIRFHNTLNRDCGYNLKSGGQNGGQKPSLEVIEKQRQGLLKHYINDPEAKQRRRIAAFRQWSNPETKQKIMGKNNGMYRRHHTEETRRKISEAATGRISWRRNRTNVRCIELDIVFDDATCAGQEMSLRSSGILGVCKKERKTCG